MHPTTTTTLRVTTLLTFIALVLGCYERVVIPARTTPAAATIFVEFDFPAEEQQRVRDIAEQHEQSLSSTSSDDDDSNAATSFAAQAEQAIDMAKRTQTDIVVLLAKDLPAKNIGHVVRGNRDGADLHLTGVTRVSGANVFVTDWQLVDPKTGIVVRAGQAPWSVVSGAPEIADNILRELVAVDLNGFAASAPVVATPTPTTPTPTTPTAPAIARSATAGDNAWAVVIGVEKYREQLVPALYADNDAVAFAKTLEATLNVPASHIKVLRGDRASRADIASALEEWLPRNARAKGGRVYVFFSGHGAPDVESGDAYLVPFDADPAYLKTRGYSIKALYASLAKLKDQQTFVFLDACFSGSGDRSVLAEGTRPLVPVKTPTTTAGIVSYAAAQPAQSTGGDTARQHGLFTVHVLDAIAGSADNNADGNVDVGELQRYVDARVEKDARLSNREQQPVLSVPAGQSASSFVLVQGLAK